MKIYLIPEKSMNRIKLNDGITASEGTSFFVLEDSLMYQKKILAAIRDIGFKGKVTLSASVKEAQEKLKDSEPGFFISDWNLPDGIGMDFLKHVREQEKFEKIPFLMITTMDSIDNILEAVRLGADGYLVKLWEKDDLVEKMTFAFEKRNPDSNLL